MVTVRIPVLILFICCLILAGYLGFANIHLQYDKLIHFSTFFILTIEFYFIFDTKFKSLKTLRWITLSICTVGGGIGSEVMQNMVNANRTFDPIDIAFNIGGSLSGVGLSVWYQSYIIRQAKLHKNRTRHALDQDQEPTDMPTHTVIHNYHESDEEGYVSIQMKDAIVPENC